MECRVSSRSQRLLSVGFRRQISWSSYSGNASLWKLLLSKFRNSWTQARYAFVLFTFSRRISSKLETFSMKIWISGKALTLAFLTSTSKLLMCLVWQNRKPHTCFLSWTRLNQHLKEQLGTHQRNGTKEGLNLKSLFERTSFLSNADHFLTCSVN